MGHFLKKDLRTHFNGFQLDVYFPRKESLCSCNSWKKALKRRKCSILIGGKWWGKYFVWFAQTDEGITDKEELWLVGIFVESVIYSERPWISCYQTRVRKYLFPTGRYFIKTWYMYMDMYGHNLHWASKETDHFFRTTLPKIHCIKINNIWTQISFNTP